MTARRWALAAAAVASLLAGCQGEDSTTDDPAAVTLTPVTGTPRFTVELSDQAVDRLGVRTKGVQQVSSKDQSLPAGSRLVVPYSGLIYDADGSTWTYVQTAANTYTRHLVHVTSVVGSQAYLRSGPKSGTQVVVVGAPELLGAEYQISGEE
ncbi:MAG: hypothetical protein WAN48_01995 [Actinomycetes bacterium]